MTSEVDARSVESFLMVIIRPDCRLSWFMDRGLFFSTYKPIGASPRRDEDGTILVCSTYSTYTVRIGTSKKGGNAPRATDKKSVCRW